MGDTALGDSIAADYHSISYLFAFVAISVADGIKPAINITNQRAVHQLANVTISHIILL